jgi:hypothetical protein
MTYRKKNTQNRKKSKNARKSKKVKKSKKAKKSKRGGTLKRGIGIGGIQFQKETGRKHWEKNEESGIYEAHDQDCYGKKVKNHGGVFGKLS